jgi:hypothetical protein
MLSPADAALLGRDAALPGLHALLDEQSFTDLLRERTGAPVDRARLDYLRYQPGTSCLATFHVQLGDETIDVHAKAYRSADRPKLDRKRAASSASSWLGGRFVLEPAMIEVAVFPADRRLPALRTLVATDLRRDTLQHALPDEPSLCDGTLTRLAYKPERRWVGELRDGAGRTAVVKAYAAGGFEAARAAARTPRVASLRLPRLLGRSRRHSLLVFDWLDGVTLQAVTPGSAAERGALRVVAEALAELHAHSGRRLAVRAPANDAATTLIAARDIAALCPELGPAADALAHELTRRLLDAPVKRRAIHGDLHPAQILFSPDRPIGLLDFDRAACGNPAVDVGSLIAHWERDVACGTLPSAVLTARREVLLSAYEGSAGSLPAGVDLYTASALFRLAPELFRRRTPEWAHGMAAVIAHCEQLLQRNN